MSNFRLDNFGKGITKEDLDVLAEQLKASQKCLESWNYNFAQINGRMAFLEYMLRFSFLNGFLYSDDPLGQCQQVRKEILDAFSFTDAPQGTDPDVCFAIQTESIATGERFFDKLESLLKEALQS